MAKCLRSYSVSIRPTPYITAEGEFCPQTADILLAASSDGREERLILGYIPFDDLMDRIKKGLSLKLSSFRSILYLLR